MDYKEGVRCMKEYTLGNVKIPVRSFPGKLISVCKLVLSEF
jgi:hypothetical protein